MATPPLLADCEGLPQHVTHCGLPSPPTMMMLQHHALLL
jgi:hypothetical protein